MSGPRYRAWRFEVPTVKVGERPADDEQRAGGPGLQISRLHGSIEMVQAHDSIRQAIFLLLSTVPGERVMRPGYGCELQRLVFSPNDDTTAALAIHYVRGAIERWEPRIEILRIDAAPDQHYAEWLSLTLEYRVRATRQTEMVVYSFSLAGDTP